MLLTELLHPGILESLAGAGHGARVLLADGHYPASTATGERARTVHLNLAPGLLDVTTVLDVLLRALPVEAAHVMVPPEGEPEPPAIDEYRSMLAPAPVGTLGRFDFYDAAPLARPGAGDRHRRHPNLRQPAADHRRPR
ncbi:RbsD/FucU domain-containing protein [Streptomyces eurythermus]